ncbi:Hypothetical protein SMAX5B_013021 [Scophthalmus maximus]|uniref:Uncharacterized protein n=1 Tax=Scophthalmus maximus TaxID=52904 RepID=A0A2U9CNV7_SCOMX|nr:Hypothetical protein SMAX5B_013021 [Scophthalmus maximus]
MRDGKAGNDHTPFNTRAQKNLKICLVYQQDTRRLLLYRKACHPVSHTSTGDPSWVFVYSTMHAKSSAVFFGFISFRDRPASNRKLHWQHPRLCKPAGVASGSCDLV